MYACKDRIRTIITAEFRIFAIEKSGYDSGSKEISSSITFGVFVVAVTDTDVKEKMLIDKNAPMALFLTQKRTENVCASLLTKPPPPQRESFFILYSLHPPVSSTRTCSTGSGGCIERKANRGQLRLIT